MSIASVPYRPGMLTRSFVFLFARARNQHKPLPWVHLMFFVSGFPALIYQIVWQRALFAIYGINVQAVTIVVSAFMLGLGLGSLAGGLISKVNRTSLIGLFAAAELGTAIFGCVSLRLFRYVGETTAGGSSATTAVICFLLVLFPTMLMGATLPLLVEHLVRASHNVGISVSSLYFANTLGSGVACFLAAGLLMPALGQTGSVLCAASMNVLVALTALAYRFRFGRRASAPDLTSATVSPRPTRKFSFLPMPLALLCAASAGFMALTYEILWYRLAAFAFEDTPGVFATLLGSYLIGLALGSRAVERYLARGRDGGSSVNNLAKLVLASSIVSFAVAPFFAIDLMYSHAHGSDPASLVASALILLSICAAAAFFGAIFPLVAHVSIDPDQRPGASLSYIYAANILGSTLGTVLVGFVLMEHLSEYQITLLVLGLGIAVALAILAYGEKLRSTARRSITVAVAVVVLVPAFSRPIFRSLYDRVLFKSSYPRLHFQKVIENRNGVIGVTPDGTVFGGGVYDGRFSVDLLHDRNTIVRPYALSAFHPAPRRVLMIGLGSGSWAQVVANNPEVHDLTVVEINPGYLSLIPKYPTVATLLHNPKVNIIIDDGRRWMVSHPNQRFDAIVMNATFHWRNHATDILSVEFVRIARAHLNPGGILFYNATGSGDVMATGLAVFRYGFRFTTCLVASDAPIVFDRDRWRRTLLHYAIDGKPVIEQAEPQQKLKLEEIVNIPDDPQGREMISVENDQQLRARLQHRTIITDDNMAAEWRKE